MDIVEYQVINKKTITVFSCRLQGKRANKAKKIIKELLKNDTCEES
ncbi:hypothetical protein B0P06_002775 [Clostridium saccharoperbutylacetonicum]|nr:hypothetical protein [Clostridium saccharoperbutylacetonicum]